MNTPTEHSVQEAVRAWGAGRHDLAGRIALELLARQPDNAVALNIAGCAAYQAGDPGAAVALLERAARHAPADAAIQANLARGELAAGRVEPALRRAHYLGLTQAAAATLARELTDELRRRARAPAIAGLFYEQDPARLAATVDAWLHASAGLTAPATQPKVLIVPHAGHVYSGATAGLAYGLLRPFAQRVQRVVLLGPAHRVAVRGVALPGVGSYVSPLGAVPVDTLAADSIGDLPCVSSRPDVHAPEHCLEVHLPFLQRVLPAFELLPLVVGDAAPADLMAVIERLWGDERTLIVISTDLSHYHGYDEAVRIDTATCQRILALAPGLDHQQACGATPLNALLAVARRRGMSIGQVQRCNSGDTAGDRARVVGYASFVLYDPPVRQVEAAGPAELSPGQGDALVRLARHVLHQVTGAPPRPAPAPHELDGVLREPGAVFVTLTRDGQLRGCIGSLQAHRPLVDDLSANAMAAALRDPRFTPVRADEAAHLRVEVSVLTPAQPMSFANESHAIWQLRPGEDGLILECHHQGVDYRATYLPQVWEQIAEPRAFLAHLKTKAGLPHDFWSPGMRLSRYAVLKFVEAG